MILSLLLTALVLAPVAEQDTPSSMTTYQMVFLKKGPNAPPSEPAAQKAMQDEHFARLAEMNKKRIAVIYGPVAVDNDLRGIAILAVPNAEEARKHFADDPFLKSGAMVADVRPWLGPKEWFHAPVGYDVVNPAHLERLVLGFLVRGPNTTHDKATAAELQKGHRAYMGSLHEQGKLVMAGPFMDNAPARGIVVYRVKDVAEAKALAADDPAVKAGRLVLEAHPWMTFKGILK